MALPRPLHPFPDFRTLSEDGRALRTVTEDGAAPNWPLVLSAIDGLGTSREVPAELLLSRLLHREDVPATVRNRAAQSLVRQNLLGSGYVSRELLLDVLSHQEVQADVKVELVARTWSSHLPPGEEDWEAARERYRTEGITWAVQESRSRESALALELVRRYSVSPLDPARVVELVRDALVPQDEATLEVFWTLLDDHLLDTWKRWRHEFATLVEKARLLA